ncbi:MAG TPA: type II toxin-antitoxin system RelE/ParE family toxin [Pyrinomonadaceae bacterium]|jgi:plasmid stabilization system protein ParE|nr:type II toxin-antitoxin system RelE/ParE family toxin [Pyrinomonadaceae bacterium]
MKVIFLDEASREFLAASDYYESRQPGLGERFEEEVDRAIEWLVENPEALPFRRGIYRRLNLHIFPYYIPYIVRSSTLWVVAVAHARRRPEYWIRRAKLFE